MSKISYILNSNADLFFLSFIFQNCLFLVPTHWELFHNFLKFCKPNLKFCKNYIHINSLENNDNINPNTFVGLVGKVRKNYLPKEEGREGGEKSACSTPARPGARTRDLSRARGGSGAVRQEGLFRQASLSVPIDRVGRLCNTMCCVFWR